MTNTMQTYRQGPAITRRRAAGQKRTPQLTVALATREARKIVSKLMSAGPEVSVESRSSFDLDTDTQTVITTVWFPRNADDASTLGTALHPLADGGMKVADSSITITRKVK